MLTKIASATAAILIATTAFAVDQGKVEKSYELKDGSTVYVFKDGKMAMENKAGQVVSMKDGHAMETKDGKQIMMKGNEIWRLDSVLHREHQTN
ncbi:periplasmic Cu(I)/Cu(II)-binding protein CopK [Aromatoleum toluclasticum]|uniref:periplasmic Cu(I)/Cu(II)-binding protein CopK n=1 Tax=Aromatoleum toluclasticum TaxID=92003 RepID=UPI00035F9032|nr:periplasmic Cu(I)/Cu(II)-binding protein CopK [Aromatoleum toluclasticum]MCC4117697.1 periplasmic Cu(I)/Cu(II)-binding protein CopK [Aromatoleum toluclasticum]